VLSALFDDLRFGTRLLRKNLGLSIATVLTFAIGIGLNAGVFTVIDGLLFRPRVAHDPASFVEMQVDRADATTGRLAAPLISLREYEAIARAGSLRAVAAWTPIHAALGDQPFGREAIPLLVSCNFFATYGPETPLLGRLFRPDDCTAVGAPPPVIVGEDLWRTSFAGNPNVVGSSLLLNQRPFTVVGVMPSGYAGQLRGPIWIPLSAARMFYGGRDPVREPSIPWLLGVVGRLRADASRTTAAAELAVIAHQLDATAANQRTTIRITTGAMIDTPVVREASGWVVPLIMAAPAVVLLIACANVALLLLSRSMARSHEVAVRISLGASPHRLLQMLLVESALLAAMAAPPSLAMAYAAPRLLRALIPALPYYPFGLDAAVLAYVIGITLFAGVAAGIAPAIESLKRNVSAALHSHEAMPGATGWRARDVLVAAQVCMSLALLVGAGLFLRAEARLLSANPGYDADGVMTVVPRVTIPPHTAESAATFYQTFMRRTRGNPAVRAVAWARGSADDSAVSSATATVVADSGSITSALVSIVSSEYFRTLQIPMIAGEPVGDDATSARSAVISESLASALWPGRRPIGSTAHLGQTEVSIAAVARNVPSIVSSAGERTIYLPAAQSRAGDAVFVSFVGSESQMAQALREGLATLDPNSVAQPLTLGAIRRDQATKFMPMVEMVVGLGLVGLGLGVAGIYGVVSFAVGRRTREMGIRIALGATRANIVHTVIWSSATPIAAGIVTGLGFAILGARVLARLFAGTPVHLDAWDPIVYSSVVVLLAAAAIVAMLGPAERAASADPVDALRQE
jgi:predicted permease